MGLFNFLFNPEKKQAKEEYKTLLLDGARAGSYDTLETKINNIVASQQLNDKDLRSVQDKVCEEYTNELLDHAPTSPDEVLGFVELIKHSPNLTDEIKDNCLYKIKYSYSFWLLENTSNLPEAFNESEVNILYKPNEVLHFVGPAILYRHATKTKRINYGGGSVSIPICKGVRYRVGSVNVDVQKQDYLKEEDIGTFYITNQRLGFIGPKKAFTINLPKLLSCQLTDEGLSIYKDGRQNPFILYLNEYNLPCIIISRLLNPESES